MEESVYDKDYLKDIKSKVSPMMKHYLETKEKYSDCILFYRLGDFYEMFFDDAKLCSGLLDLVLTGKECGLEKRAPMVGLPYHAADQYIAKLVEAGHKVAICEQLSDPATSKGLVDRDVIRIVTPGTTIEDEALKADKNNFLLSIFADKNGAGVCWADISTGLMETCEYQGAAIERFLDDVLSQIKPSEIVACEYASSIEGNLSIKKMGYIPSFQRLPDADFLLAKAEKLLKEQFGVSSLDVFDVSGKKYCLKASGALIKYVEDTQKRMVSNIKKLSVVKDERYVHLDLNTRRNLELVENSSTKKKRGSLLWLLDQTKTSMGARKLRQFIDQPLRDANAINARLDGVSELFKSQILREDLSLALSSMIDLERKCSKVSAGTITPKECYSLGQALTVIPKIKSLIEPLESSIMQRLKKRLVNLDELSTMLTDAINPDSSSNLKEGGYIAVGFNEELDRIRRTKEYGKQWLAELEQNERERTGIRNLRTGYNRVFGYYIEISKSWLAQVPDNYVRKQSLTTGERFVTQELKEMENKLMTATDEALAIEERIFSEIKQTLGSYIDQLLMASDAIAVLDCLLSFATVSQKHHYTRPLVGDFEELSIVDGRHPVVEALLEGGQFTPNDTNLDCGDNRTMLITGPNMAGKSTYMRQVAIITLMAHIGCFVPAKEATIGIVDRIFTRVGASDDLAFGQSTFMVEMTEVANIIENATNKSLIILDEVGRGTSTYDGLSIAWAIMEYLAKHLKAKTLFATHYHELTELEGQIDGVKNYRIMVKELEDSIIFLHKIARGSANRSFGIEVAKLAGLPDELLKRAKEVLKTQESADRRPRGEGQVQAAEPNTAEVMNILRELDMDNISPIMAFGTLQNLVDKVKK